MHRAVCLIVLVLLPSAAGKAAAQRHQLASPTKTPNAAITVAVGGKVAGKKIDGSGMGSCSHAADTSISGVSASLWKVEYSGTSSVKQLNLTLWRPKDEGPDQLMLGVETKSGSYRIETGNPGDGKGEGSVTILPSGPGGRLEIRGKEAGGKPVQITIDCSGFAEAQGQEDAKP